MAKILTLTVGLPRSGKTTWTLQQLNAIAINPDAIRLALTNQAFVPNAEPWIWAQTDLMVRSLFLYGYNDLILDATNVSEQRLVAWTKIPEQLNLAVFHVTPAECIERAQRDQRFDLIPVIERQSEFYESLLAKLHSRYRFTRDNPSFIQDFKYVSYPVE